MALDNNGSIKAVYLSVDYGRAGGGFTGVSNTTSVTRTDSPEPGFSQIIDNTTTLAGRATTVGVNYRLARAAVVAKY